jgi:hypothetical protein
VGNGGNDTNVKFQPTFNNTQVATGTTGASNVYQVTTEQTTNPDGTPNNGVAGTTLDTPNANNSALKNAKSQVNPNVTDCTQITQVTAHEIGHTVGLGDCLQCTQPKTSVMLPIPCKQSSGGICIIPDWNNTANGLPAPTTCDNSTVSTVYNPPPPPPCPYGCTIRAGSCFCPPSPIILDLSGQGFFLTNAANGVLFDIMGNGHAEQMAWTAEGANNAFLALPGPDGLIHNGKQLFGNFTPQPPSDHPNGFAALAVYDDPKNGGNGDGIIDARDAVFNSLRLWVDANHDGISQPNELYTLPSLGVTSIGLNYRESRRTDQYGNEFRYRAPVNGDDVRKTA